MIDNRPKLVLLNTEDSGREFVLSKNVTIIGRSPDCDVVVEQPSVSRNHARIERFGDHYVASDLGSRNGIKIDDRPVPEGRILNKALLTVGDVVFRAEGIAEDGAGPAPPLRKALRDRSQEEPTPAPLVPAYTPGEPEADPSKPVGEETEVPLRPAISARQQALAEQAERFGPALIVALAVLLSLGSLYLAWSLFGVRDESLVMELQPVKVQVNENYWTYVWGTVNVGGRLVGGSAEVVPSTISTDPPGVARVESFRPKELVVTGLSYGDTIATMQSTKGNLVRLKIMVRGRLDTPEEAIRRSGAAFEERVELARKRIEAGDIFMNRDAPYRAQVEYERAELYVQASARARHLHVEARRKARQAEAEAKSRYEKLADAADLARKNGNYEAALAALQDIIALIPDTNDPRNQRARFAAVTWELESEKRP